MTTPSGRDRHLWYLEGLAASSQRLWRTPILHLPFVVGRLPGCDLTLQSDLISKHHAEIFSDQGVLMLRDLGSTNGTFVNGERLGKPVVLSEGDVLHFASFEYRAGSRDRDDFPSLLSTPAHSPATPPHRLVAPIRRLVERLRHGGFQAVFQPVVSLEEGVAVGYEALGRLAEPGLPELPLELFELAQHVGLESALSEAWREAEIVAAASFVGERLLFLNCHPNELREQALLAKLAEARHRLPRARLVLEIHEAAVAELGFMRDLRRRLGDLEVQLAYDDFGAGRARLNELGHVPPDYLKFDRTLLCEIDRAAAPKQQLLRALVRLARDLGVEPIAEGIENEGEAAFCRDCGFSFAQGYYFGWPQAAAELAAGR